MEQKPAVVYTHNQYNWNNYEAKLSSTTIENIDL